MRIAQYDARSGGSYRYVHRDDDGTEYGFHSVLHEVRPNERIVQTFTYEGFPDGVSLETAVFEDLGGRTRVTGKSLMDSIEARDSMLKSGMVHGVREGYERLDDRLDELLGGQRSSSAYRHTERGS
ncbi:SRPBCC domain-containing protein [Streptomyces chartreusis]|uniref:SRPBCC domain-containing protein n=1 Tax=Streptomyces chartreusis TaxID=1969 RepID=UPI00362E3F1F